MCHKNIRTSDHKEHQETAGGVTINPSEGKEKPDPPGNLCQGPWWKRNGGAVEVLKRDGHAIKRQIKKKRRKHGRECKERWERMGRKGRGASRGFAWGGGLICKINKPGQGKSESRVIRLHVDEEFQKGGSCEIKWRGGTRIFQKEREMDKGKGGGY